MVLQSLQDARLSFVIIFAMVDFFPFVVPQSMKLNTVLGTLSIKEVAKS